MMIVPMWSTSYEDEIWWILAVISIIGAAGDGKWFKKKYLAQAYCSFFIYELDVGFHGLEICLIDSYPSHEPTDFVL